MQSRIFHVWASQPAHTPAGNLLSRMFYGRFLDKVLSREQLSGCPHNGGEHTLTLCLSLEDLKAFLDLVLETFKDHDGAVPFVASIKERFAKDHPTSAGSL